MQSRYKREVLTELWDALPQVGALTGGSGGHHLNKLKGNPLTVTKFTATITHSNSPRRSQSVVEGSGEMSHTLSCSPALTGNTVLTTVRNRTDSCTEWCGDSEWASVVPIFLQRESVAPDCHGK